MSAGFFTVLLNTLYYYLFYLLFLFFYFFLFNYFYFFIFFFRGLNLNMSAAEMRAYLASKKKRDIRQDSIDMKKKHQIIQRL